MAGRVFHKSGTDKRVCATVPATSSRNTDFRSLAVGSAGLLDLWRPYAAGGLRVKVVPGTHVNMISEPHVEILAEAIEEVIAGVPAAVA